MRRFKLRAENMQDALNFVLLCGHGNCEDYDIDVNPDKEDVTLEFYSPLELKVLQEVLKPITGNDLMFSTLAHIENYTGNYIR